jgi:hypothetical protein
MMYIILQLMCGLIQNQIFSQNLSEYMDPLGRPRRRWEDNIKMDLKKIECGGMYWVDIF